MINTDKIKEFVFYKTEAGGNDFINFLDPQNMIPIDMIPELARRLCPRGKAIGADGIVIATGSTEADLRMIYFNADGSRASLCGNGLRALGLLAHRENLVDSKHEIETDAGIYTVDVLENNIVRNSFDDPVILNPKIDITADTGVYGGILLSVGIPYFCVFVDAPSELAALDVPGIGRYLRYHKKFDPVGANVTFICKDNSSKFLIRIYERGVEDETLSSGTGAYSSAVAGFLKYGGGPPFTVESPGAKVIIGFEAIESKVKKAWIEGGARILYRANIIDAL